jgi:hypothetical protein
VPWSYHNICSCCCPAYSLESLLPPLLLSSDPRSALFGSGSADAFLVGSFASPPVVREGEHGKADKLPQLCRWSCISKRDNTTLSDQQPASKIRGRLTHPYNVRWTSLQYYKPIDSENIKAREETSKFKDELCVVFSSKHNLPSFVVRYGFH